MLSKILGKIHSKSYVFPVKFFKTPKFSGSESINLEQKIAKVLIPQKRVNVGSRHI